MLKLKEEDDGILKKSEVLVERTNFVNEDGEGIMYESFTVDKNCVNHLLSMNKGTIKLIVNGTVKTISKDGLDRVYRLSDGGRYTLDMRSRLKNDTLQKQIAEQEKKLNEMKKVINNGKKNV